jgi:hypothetical protein
MRNLISSLLLALALFSGNLFAADTVKVSGIINTFSSGELSPMLDGRTDLQAYYSGVKTAENFIVLPFGGLARRPGTYYVAAVKNSSDTTRLIPFQFSTEQAYIIEAGNQYMRYYMDNGTDIGQITNGGVVYEIVTPYTKDEIFDLQYVQDADTMYFVQSDHKPQKLTRTGHISWNMTDYTPAGDPFGGYDSYTKLLLHFDGVDGNTTFTDEIGKNITTYNGAKLNTTNKKFGTASASFDGSDDYAKILGNADFNLTGDFTIDLWVKWLSVAAAQAITGNGYTSGGWMIYYDPALPGLKFYANSVPQVNETFTPVVNTTYHIAAVRESGTIKIYVNGASVSSGTYTADITTAGELRIGTDTDGAFYFNGWLDELRLSKGIARWSGNFTPPTAQYNQTGYPNSIAIYEQRLALAAPPAEPQTIWMSKSGDYDNMTIGTADDAALSYTIASEQVNAIKWLSAGKTLMVGTSGGIWSASSGSAASAITPTNILVKRESSFGSNDVMPVRIGNYIYYLQRNGKILRELQYTYDLDEFQANDITILSEHITGDGIVEMAYQQSPYNILWCAREDGELATFTRQVEHKVLAWSRQVTDGKYESVAVIPGNNTDDQVWFIVNRTINGSVVKDVEYLMPFFNYTNQSDAFFVDCGLSLYNGTNTSTVGGLEHLANTTVAVLGDGIVLDDELVVAGNITLSSASKTVHVGLPYNSTLQTMRLESDTGLGTAQGKIKRINKVQVRLYESYGGKLGHSEQLDNITYDNTTFFTGDKEIVFPSLYDKDAYVYIEEDDPVPFNVLAIMPDFSVSDY